MEHATRRWIDALATALAVVVLPSAACAQSGAQFKDGTGLGYAISDHNYLHYKQEADRLYADYRKALARDHGQLSPNDRDVLQARYDSFTLRVNRLLADERGPSELARYTGPR